MDAQEARSAAPACNKAVVVPGDPISELNALFEAPWQKRTLCPFLLKIELKIERGPEKTFNDQGEG
jgi:hypothetical protein